MRSPTSSPVSPTLYVGDGFGAVHRKHASVYDVPQRLPHAAGDLVVTETEVLGRLTGDPDRPYVVVLGGSKVSDKLGVIDNLIGTVDRLLIGGGMVFTFLKAQGHEVGKSLLEEDQLDAVRGYLEQAKSKGVEIVLPVDVVAATEFSADADHDVVGVDGIPADRLGLDIGPESGTLFAAKIADARTVFWNGPMGVFELAPYAEGTRAVAQAHHRGHRGRRPDRRRRWRLGRRGPQARLRREGVQPHLDRGRRQPRAPRGQGASRSHRTGRWTATTWHAPR